MAEQQTFGLLAVSLLKWLQARYVSYSTLFRKAYIEFWHQQCFLPKKCYNIYVPLKTTK